MPPANHLAGIIMDRNRGFERLGLLDELLIDGPRLRAESAGIELIWRIADNHVELHIASKYPGDPSLDCRQCG